MNINDFVGGFDNTYQEEVISGYNYEGLLDELLDNDIEGGYDNEYDDNEDDQPLVVNRDFGYNDLITNTTNNNYEKTQESISISGGNNKTEGNIENKSTYNDVANYLRNVYKHILNN